MHHPALARAARCLAAAVLLGAALPALADDYGDVNQLAKNGQTEQALTRADQYLANHPRDPQMRFLKGVVLTQAGRTTEAIEVYQQLTQEYAELAEPFNNLAALYAAQGQLDKARIALESALRANPSYATAQENLGDVYARLANESYARVMQLDPKNVTTPPKLALTRQLVDRTTSASR
jgi:Flp pilus assembly protein TadD